MKAAGIDGTELFDQVWKVVILMLHFKAKGTDLAFLAIKSK